VRHFRGAVLERARCHKADRKKTTRSRHPKGKGQGTPASIPPATPPPIAPNQLSGFILKSDDYYSWLMTIKNH
jgi:hypothetical protein